MTWDHTKPPNPKYRTPEHRAERRRLETLMRMQGYLVCAQPTCLADTRTITPDQPWHAGHDDTGHHYIGPVHSTCNTTDGARRARARQLGTPPPGPKRWTL
jgi:hypothetical protein